MREFATSKKRLVSLARTSRLSISELVSSCEREGKADEAVTIIYVKEVLLWMVMTSLFQSRDQCIGEHSPS